MTPKLILFGLPGSGKDTQAACLSDQLGIPAFSMGGVLRDEIARGTETGRMVAPFVESGTIVPAGIAGALMRERLLEPSVQATGYAINGYPRSRASFEAFLTWDKPTAVFILDVPRDVTRARLLARGRSDDTDAVIDARFRAYDETDVPCQAWLATTGIRVVRVDGTKTVEEITDEIIDAIGA